MFQIQTAANKGSMAPTRPCTPFETAALAVNAGAPIRVDVAGVTVEVANVEPGF